MFPVLQYFISQQAVLSTQLFILTDMETTFCYMIKLVKLSWGNTDLFESWAQNEAIVLPDIQLNAFGSTLGGDGPPVPPGECYWKS